MAVVAVPASLTVFGIIVANEFPDYEADKKAGKANLVVRLGPSRARYAYCGIMCAGFGSIIPIIATADVTFLAMLSFIAFPLTLKAMKVAWTQYLSHENIVPAQALTIQTLIAHGLLLSLGLVLGRFLGL